VGTGNLSFYEEKYCLPVTPNLTAGRALLNSVRLSLRQAMESHSPEIIISLSGAAGSSSSKYLF